MDAALISAIGSPRRREILRLLWGQELTAGAIHQAMPDVTFGAVSLQLKVLADAGLVESRPDAQFRVYKVRRDALGPVAAMLEEMWTDALWHLKLKAELKESRRGPRPRRRTRPRTVASALRRKPHETKGKKR
jgi:DNA-binding transcriptional ArsR family regulator